MIVLVVLLEALLVHVRMCVLLAVVLMLMFVLDVLVIRILVSVGVRLIPVGVLCALCHCRPFPYRLSPGYPERAHVMPAYQSPNIRPKAPSAGITAVR